MSILKYLLLRIKFRKPRVTPEMRMKYQMWALTDNGWIKVCYICGGNCGGCGHSVAMGYPASMDRIIKISGMWKGLPSR